MDSLKDVEPGDFYTTDGKDVWEVLYYCTEPTITFRNVKTDERRGGSVYSLNVKPFIKLLPEKPIK